MGFWERLIGSEFVQSRDTRELVQDLMTSYSDERGLAQQIRDHAEHSPHRSGMQQLRGVATVQDHVVQLLHDAIRAHGETANQGLQNQQNQNDQSDEHADVPLPKGGKNHWARVVHDLEDNQALMKRYGEQGIYWDPELPDVVALFRSLEQEKSRIGAQLRDIALRADSHALD